MSFLGQGPECHSHTSCCDGMHSSASLYWGRISDSSCGPSLRFYPKFLLCISYMAQGLIQAPTFQKASMSSYHLPQPMPIHPEHGVTQTFTMAWVSQIPISRGHKTYLWNHTPYSLTLAVVSWVLALEMYCSIHFFAFGKFSICYFPKTHTYS